MGSLCSSYPLRLFDSLEIRFLPIYLIDPIKLIGFFAEIDVSSSELSLSLSNNACLASDVLICCRISFRARGLR